ncbi:DNA repair protein RecN (Recombination protein N) [Sphingomonas jejuensis]|uniref:DNA repair protein RecN n=1 Tax=Sphingomonas jejuensis TaxID=904715 RepID=A0ABX0XM61_9SPHN|nr:DNA repair protein RecN [Sphingomonas jejuensis]NJC34473.1 DNA repair protein RecN (Recombination protein N) [Sphingomonas jejuensis]
MLTSLAIRDVVLIEALDLDFGPGLTVLTGETGAGKSILLDALGLALGARADAGLVRSGSAQASVVATFDPPPAGGALAERLADGGIDLEPGEPLVIRRLLKADGGSRAFVADQPASVALLREIGAGLVEIHGQHDDRGLLDRAGHRALLDVFGRLDSAGVATLHKQWRAAEAALSAAAATLAEAERERDWLTHAVAELTAFDAQPGEEEALADERATIQRGARSGEELAAVVAHLEGSDGALAQLRQAARRLERIAADHPLLSESLAALDRAVIEASEGEDRLAAARDALAYDPGRLELIEARLFDLRALARKHRVDATALSSLTAELSTRLTAIEAGEEGIAALARTAAEARAAYVAAAETLSRDRADAAERLDAAVAEELAPLKLDAARFRTVVEVLSEDGWSTAGRDRVEFEISTNPGAPFGPLVKVASGGELSRFILALKVALAAEGGAPTMIFDEIDRGVGGAVASAIGDRLARLSATAQLLVVTHSPQVAARGAQHLLIAKSHEAGHEGLVTRTSLRPLDADDRREEIARMLSGADVTDEARAQAARLLGQPAPVRQGFLAL